MLWTLLPQKLQFIKNGGFGKAEDWRNGHMSINSDLEVIAKLKELGLQLRPSDE